MKAVEFIRKFGWEVARDSVEFSFRKGLLFLTIIDNGENCPSSAVGVNMYDLRRLVESHELVKSYGGIDKAKIELSKQSILRWINPETEKLREAIALVEEI